jgi:5-formyltetrahydrofolate cyclo-ligase
MSERHDATKERLRVAARERRDAIAAAQRAEWSRTIAAHGLPALRERVLPETIVSAYWPMRSEADPRPLAHALAAAGAQLCLPAFVGKVMEFRRWRDGDELAPAGFQTFEPRASAPVVAPTLVLAPLLAFDRRGGRLGWGKGYYDTFLGGLDAAAAAGAGTRPFVVGIAFALQEVDEVPVESHDRRLDAVVTEHGCHRC